MDSVLIIDDDRELCELVKELLEEEGFKVETVSNSAKGLERALSGQHRVVVLDVMMPGMNGLEVLRRLRAAPHKAARTPVMMLTARGEDVDRIVGLEIGADDYLPKPFNPRELVARINAIIRRLKLDSVEAYSTPSDASSLPERITVGDVEVETGTRHVLRGGLPVELTNVEYEILVLLLLSAGRIVRRDDLVKAVLGRQLSTYDRSIDMHISHLRKKLGHRMGDVDRLKTVRGVGYIYARLGSAGLSGESDMRSSG